MPKIKKVSKELTNEVMGFVHYKHVRSVLMVIIGLYILAIVPIFNDVIGELFSNNIFRIGYAIFALIVLSQDWALGLLLLIGLGVSMYASIRRTRDLAKQRVMDTAKQAVELGETVVDDVLNVGKQTIGLGGNVVSKGLNTTKQVVGLGGDVVKRMVDTGFDVTSSVADVAGSVIGQNSGPVPFNTGLDDCLASCGNGRGCTDSRQTQGMGCPMGNFGNDKGSKF